MRSAGSDRPSSSEPLVIRLGDQVYRRVGSCWVDQHFIVVHTSFAAHLDRVAYRLSHGEQPGADDLPRSDQGGTDEQSATP